MEFETAGRDASRSLRRRILAASVGPAIFLLMVLLAGAVGGGLRIDNLFLAFALATETETETETETADLKVTHIIFNWEWSPSNEGPDKTDALSMRQDFSRTLDHGPHQGRSESLAKTERGAGEWIVLPPGGSSKRNEPALYLRQTEQGKQKLFIYARFEATENVVSADIFFVPQGSFGALAPKTVQFVPKKDGGSHNKFEGLKTVSQLAGGGTVATSLTRSNDPEPNEFVKLEVPVALQDVIRKSKVTFEWKAENIQLTEGGPLKEPQDMNISGLAGPQRPAGHPIYTVLDKPTAPWYFGDLSRHLPWEKALDEVTRVDAADGANTLEGPGGAGGKLAEFIFSKKGYGYEKIAGAPGWSRGGNTTNVRFDLQHFIDLRSGLPFGANVGCCYDYAAGLTTYMNLVGASSGYIRKELFGYLFTFNLIDEGMVNNPFFNNTKFNPEVVPPKIIPANDPRFFRKTRKFKVHTYVVFRGVVYDATTGAEKGTLTEDAYLKKLIDQVTSDRAEDIHGEDFTSPGLGAGSVITFVDIIDGQS